MLIPTRDEVYEFVQHSNYIEGLSDPKHHDQSMVAWDYLMGLDYVTDAAVKKLQKLITLTQNDLRPDWRGYYRNQSGVEVTVGGRICPKAREIPGMMTAWLIKANNEPEWKIDHVAFEKIHPFADGNGRTGRMLMNWQRIVKEGLPILIIHEEERFNYYKWFRDE